MTPPPAHDAAAIAEIAKRLTHSHFSILDRIANGQRLLHATRAEDSFRQSMRRKGLIQVEMNPRRWVLTPLGLAVRASLAQSKGEE